MPNKVFRLIIDMDARRAKRGAAEATTAFGRLSGRLARIGPLAGLAAAGMAAMFVRGSIRKAIEQEQALALVASQIRATGAAAGLATSEIANYASELQRATGVGDESILRSSAVLLSFKQIAGDVFKDTLRLSQDLATVMGTDLNSALLQLSKALADPTRRLTELSRSGIIFTEAQKEIVNSLVETNRLAEAQAFILAEIESQYGGAAEAARDTLGGALRQLGSDWGDLQENLILGTGANNPIRIFVEEAISALQFLNDNFPKISRGYNSLIAGLLFQTASLLEGFRDLVAIFPEFVAGEKFFEDLNAAINRARQGGLNALADSLGSVAEQLTQLPQDPFEPTARSAEGAAQQVEALKQAIADFNREADKISSSFFEDLFGPDLFPTDTAQKFAADLTGNIATSLEESVQALDPSEWIDPEVLWEGALIELEDELTDTIIESGTEAANRIDWSGMGRNLQEAMQAGIGGAIGAVVTGVASGSSGQAIGASVGAIAGTIIGGIIGSAVPVIGTIIGAAVGSAIGSAIGGLIGGLFDDSGKGTVARVGFGPEGGQILEGESERLKGVLERVEAAFRNLNETISGSIDLTESFNISIKENDRFFANFFNAAGEAIGSAEFESFEAALEFALARVLSTSIVNAEGPLAAAFAEVIGNAAKRGFDQTVADIELLAGLSDSLDALLGNFNLANDPVLASIDTFRKSIDAMGLSAETAAPLLDQLAAAEAQRIEQLQISTLDRLFSFFEGTAIAEERRFELAEAKLKLEFRILKAQLIQLDLWDKATRRLFNLAQDLAFADIDINLSGPLDVRVIDDFSESTQADEDLRIRKEMRADLQAQLAELRGLRFDSVQEIRDLANINFLGFGFWKNTLGPLIGELVNQRSLDIRTQLLDLVRDDPRFAEEFRANQERLIRLEFEMLRREQLQLDAELRLLNEEIRLFNESNDDPFDDIPLIEAASTWEDLAELWEAALEAALADLDNVVDSFAAAIEALIAFRDSLLTGPGSPLSLEEQLGIAQSEFDALVAAALAGDTDAANALPAAANVLLDIAEQLFGSTAAFTAIFDQVLAALDSVIALGGGGAAEDNPTAVAVRDQTEQQVPIMAETLNVLSDMRDQNAAMARDISLLQASSRQQSNTLARLER